MYIKNIELDGFKSYAKRTEVRDFDKLFNAITGLNGSGKSNILDSICFLLGISQLSAVRASNLNDLVYKNGQAGITRASVSIAFDNTDKENSPVGYHTYNEILVTRQINAGESGKNKYLINGVNVQKNKVEDFFQSVGLNINNPHFLIMQGRVTKVMNMKPIEILSMIEEATGTRMYEQKRENSRKMKEKKQLKWQEITNILQDEIQPKIARLKEDREAYLEYQRLGREIEQNEKLVIAFKYHKIDQKLASSDEKENSLKNTELEKNAEKEEVEKEAEEVAEVISQMKEQNDAERGGKMGELEAQLSGFQSEFAKKQAAKKSEQESLKSCQKQVDAKKKEIAQKTKLVEKKTSDRAELAESHESNEQNADKAEQEYKKAETMLEQLRVGASVGAEGTTTIAQQVVEKRQIVSSKKTEIKASKARQNQLTKDQKSLNQKLKKSSTQNQADINQLEKCKSELQKVEQKLSEIDYDESHQFTLSTRMDELNIQHRELADQEYNFYQAFSRVNLDNILSVPRNFDRSRIKGLAIDLIKVTNMDFVCSIEKAAGGKLYQLVVDTAETAQFLIRNKCLKIRTTMVMMDKVQASRPVDPRKVNLGKQRVGNQHCYAVRDLVTADPEFESILDYCFNGVMCARTSDQAHKLCYDRDINNRVIAATGEDFNPDGVLRGGKTQTKFVLKEITKLRDIKRRKAELEHEHRNVKAEMDKLQGNQAAFLKLDKQRNTVSAKCEQIQNRVNQSEFGQYQSELERVDSELKAITDSLESATQIHDQALAEAEEIEERMRNLEKNRDQELKRLQKEVDKKRGIMEKAIDNVEQHQGKFEGLAMEIAELKNECQTAENELKKADSELEVISKKLEEKIAICDEGQTKIDEVKKLIQEQRDLILSRDQEISGKKDLEKDLQKRIKQLEQEISRCKHDIELHRRENANDLKERKVFEEKYSWIAKDKELFGLAHSAYDFKVRDPIKAERDLNRARNQKEKLNGQINQRAMALLAQAEKTQDELIVKRDGVKEEQKRLQDTIDGLDKKKKDEITRAYKEVNQNFDSIFGSLLPQAKAKLQPPEGKDVLDGLEFRVGFGGVWKDNLGELSGGQRSLVALSLILAMLLLKPAPIYILDEVDAALDLSHTQNIGSMLKNHFKKSQFIIVSLKDGMFENANVLYRTKFVDGVSTVTRVAAAQRKKPITSEADKENVPRKRKNHV